MMTVSEGEASIALDSLNAIRAHYPDADLWLLDDCSEDGTAEQVERWARMNKARFHRNPVRRGYRGNAHCIFRLFHLIASSGQPYGMVIKLDPDTRIVRPGLAELLASRQAAEGPGIVGACWHSPDGRVRRTVKKQLITAIDLSPIGPDHLRKLRVGWPFYARWALRGLVRGHLPGWHALGALYAIDGGLVSALEAEGYWTAIPPDFHALLHSEDLLVSLGVAAIGGRLIDINPPGQTPTWLQYLPPVPWTAEEMVSGGLLAVHPLKRGEPGDTIRRRLWELVPGSSPHVGPSAPD